MSLFFNILYLQNFKIKLNKKSNQKHLAAKLERVSRDDSTSQVGEIDVEDVAQTVLFGICEKLGNTGVNDPAGHPDGFPKPISLGELSHAGAKKKGKSLFKQRMEQKRKQNIKSEIIPQKMPIVVDEQIHLENANRIASLSAQELEQERQEWLIANPEKYHGKRANFK